MSTEPFDTDVPAARRDRQEHGGAPARLDDEELALRTARERVEAGVADYVPEDVPPATDEEPSIHDRVDLDAVEGIEAVALRREGRGETARISEDNPFPPTRYADS